MFKITTLPIYKRETCFCNDQLTRYIKAEIKLRYDTRITRKCIFHVFHHPYAIAKITHNKSRGLVGGHLTPLREEQKGSRSFLSTFSIICQLSMKIRRNFNTSRAMKEGKIQYKI